MVPTVAERCVTACARENIPAGLALDGRSSRSDVSEDLRGKCLDGRRRSLWMVGRWPAFFPDVLGVIRSLYPSLGVTGGWNPPPEGCMSPALCRLCGRDGKCWWRTSPWGTQRRQLDGLWAPSQSDRSADAASRGGDVGFGGLVRPDRLTILTSFERALPAGLSGPPGHDSYLVDSASSHMLVSKIKPCMSKYKQSIR